MDRREVLKKLGFAVVAGAVASPALAGAAPAPKRQEKHLDGVLIVRYPPGSSHYADAMVDNQDIAKELAMAIGPGAKIVLPSDRDEHGGYRWDIVIVGTPQSQITVEHKD